MKKMIFKTLFVVGCMLLLGTSAMAQDDPVEAVIKGCEKELTAYCKDVTPGQARGLACLYAHEDKLSGRCEYALYDAAAQLQRFVTAMNYVANECREDLMTHCADIKTGQGRLLHCLEKKMEKVSGRCQQAIKDVGLGKK